MASDGDKPEKADEWESFDWDRLGDDTPTNGRGAVDSLGDLFGVNDSTGDETSAEGEWVTRGGVLHWEEPEGTPEDIASDLRREARSPWASDTLTLPLGAPDALRVRAVRAWLARQRMLENEAMGVLLLERRQHMVRDDDETGERGVSATSDVDPIDIELAEHQAAVGEYESLLEALDQVSMHNGPGRVLVEYHFLIGDRIAVLATEPDAPEDFGEMQLFAAIERRPATTPVTPQSQAEWEGRAGAVLQTRRRVERMAAPEEEE